MRQYALRAKLAGSDRICHTVNVAYRMDNVKSVIKKIGDATRRGRVTRREAQNNVLELSKELNEVNMNLQAVFMQLSEIDKMVSKAEMKK